MQKPYKLISNSLGSAKGVYAPFFVMKIVVSACLAGFSCRYDGKANTVPYIQDLYAKKLVLPVCPECLGGLSTPRIPCEIQQDKVISAQRIDCTSAYQKGALLALQYARFYGAKMAILKAKSPSCGVGQIYDGTFTKTLIAGNGIFAQLLMEHHFFVCTEKDDFREKFLQYLQAVI